MVGFFDDDSHLPHIDAAGGQQLLLHMLLHSVYRQRDVDVLGDGCPHIHFHALAGVVDLQILQLDFLILGKAFLDNGNQGLHADAHFTGRRLLQDKISLALLHSAGQGEAESAEHHHQKPCQHQGDAVECEETLSFRLDVNKVEFDGAHNQRCTKQHHQERACKQA